MRGYRIKFHNSSLALSLFVDPKSRYTDEMLLEKYLRPGDVFIDVGANIGTISIKGSLLVGSYGKVFSFEPHPEVFAYLKENIMLNHLDNIKAYNVALGATNHYAYLSDLNGDDQNHILRDGSGIRVFCSRLDTHFNDIFIPRIHLIKIDVEGVEYDVLKGAENVLKKTIAVYFECHDKNNREYGYHSSEICAFLIDKGFSNFLLRETFIEPFTPNPEISYRVNILALRHPLEFQIRTQLPISVLNSK